MNRTIFDPKYMGETKNYVFDFISQLALGETLDTAEVTATVYAGDDDAPEDIVNGAANISNEQVSQSFTGGVIGVTYFVVCEVTTSEDQTLRLGAYLAIQPNQS